MARVGLSGVLARGLRLLLVRAALGGASPGALQLYPPNVSSSETLVNHFDPTDDRVFSQRILTYSAWWQKGGPILLYLGNEGPVDTFYNNTGAVFEHAQALQGMAVFVEHRYYGKSRPGNGSDFRFLAVEQALADFAVFVRGFRERLGCGRRECPVVTFGGSYGGMLVVWFRQKYPQLTVGGVGSGAVIDFYPRDRRQEAFWNATVHTFGSFGTAGCASRLQGALAGVSEAASTAAGRGALRERLGSCHALANETTAGAKIDFFLRGVISSLAMLDYPVACDFVRPLPANPVAEACSRAARETEPVSIMRRVVDFYLNSTGDFRCYDFLAEPVGRPTSGALLGPRAPPDMGRWQYQACSQMPMQALASDGYGFYVPSDSQLEEVSASCRLRFGVTPRADWLPLSLGASDLRIGNLVLIDGEKDPWRAGSVKMEQVRPGLDIQHHVVPAAAHHEDLRFDSDPVRPEVSNAKQLAREAMRRWIAAATADRSGTSKLSVNVVSDSIPLGPLTDATILLT